LTVTNASQPAYVCIPRRLLLHPPIAHRGSTASARVSAFEFAILAGVLVEARIAASHVGHVKSFAAGGKDIALERTFGDELKQEWKEVKRLRLHGEHAAAPERYHAWRSSEDGGHDHAYKPRMQRGKALKRAGSLAYHKERKKLRRRPLDSTVTVTRYALLRSACLPKNGGNQRDLAGALDRLCKPVGGGAPPLLDWREQEDGRLRLEVSRQWLQKPYARLPLPLPRQPTALAFLLFASGITGPGARTSKRSIGFAQLCDRLGVSLQRGERVATRALEGALHAMNDWLEALQPERAALAKLKPTLITPPASYSMTAVGDDRSGVQLQAHAYQLDERELEEPEATVEEIMDASAEEKQAREQRVRHRLSPADRQVAPLPPQPIAEQDDADLPPELRRERKLLELREQLARSAAKRERHRVARERCERLGVRLHDDWPR
jgi:hypothetical protein